MCRLCRRGFLTGLSALGAHTALPAWAQFGNAIQPQNDPWAQVDPYADARNGFPGGGGQEQRPPKEKSAYERTFGDAAKAEMLPDDVDEVQMGLAAYPGRLRNAGGVHPDRRLQAALRAFCKPLFEAADRRELPWVVTLTDNPNPNASAGAGGTVIVHSGMISIYDTPGELAATLAHEIGHVDKKHVVNSMDVARTVEAMRRAGIKPTGGDTMTALAPEAENVFADYYALLHKVYRKENEAEADAHEIVIFERLGIDPIHAINDQKKALILDKIFGDSGKDSWTRSHPPTPDRLRHIEGLAAMSARPRRDFAFEGWDILKKPFPTPPAFKLS